MRLVSCTSSASTAERGTSREEGEEGEGEKEEEGEAKDGDEEADVDVGGAIVRSFGAASARPSGLPTAWCSAKAMLRSCAVACGRCLMSQRR